jgi:hypothetical protein
MLFDWNNYVPAVKRALGRLGKTHPRMLAAYQGLAGAASEGDALDAKTRELIAVAVGVSLRCDGCIGTHTRPPAGPAPPRPSWPRPWPRPSRSMPGRPTSIRCGLSRLSRPPPRGLSPAPTPPCHAGR